MRMTAYWKIVLKRFVDWIALQLRFLIQKVVNKEIEMELNEVIVRGGGIEKMLDEPPSVAIKREKLQRSIGLLKESKEVIEQSNRPCLQTNGLAQLAIKSVFWEVAITCERGQWLSVPTEEGCWSILHDEVDPDGCIHCLLDGTRWPELPQLPTTVLLVLFTITVGAKI
nr:dynamin-related protein 4C-like [Tanacetum cinerariifolium]